MIFKIFATNPTIRAPMIIPTNEPSPPYILVPPSTTAMITSNSNPAPTLGVPDPSLEARVTPAKAERVPTRMYKVETIAPILTPESCAATLFAPMTKAYFVMNVLE